MYAASSGYVYHYTYEGYRHATHDGASGKEFVFLCTSDRSARLPIAVFGPDESFDAWEQASGRELNDVERYAIVKMRLFEIFDTRGRLTGDICDWLDEERVRRQVEALDL